jgi:threonine 3-dehydrogenase
LAEHIILKGTKVYGIFGREMFKTWYQSKALVQSGQVNLKQIITHSFPLAEFPKAMKTLEEGNCGKVVIKM